VEKQSDSEEKTIHQLLAQFQAQTDKPPEGTKSDRVAELVAAYLAQLQTQPGNALGAIQADLVSAINASGVQFIEKQLILALIDPTASQTPSPGSSQRSDSLSPHIVLPQVDTPFFTGRAAELEKLAALLIHPDGPRLAGIVGVAGTGGMGKSMLAFHFATHYGHYFPDGVIGLRVDNAPIDTLARNFAREVREEIDPSSKASASQIMQSVFGQRRALLIFDNADEAVVSELHPGGKQCAVIVTTRNRGLLASFRIPPGAFIDLEGFTLQDTRDFLIKRLGEGDRRVIDEPEAVEAVHNLVGGLPLALDMLGSTLFLEPFTPLTDYVRLLEDKRTRLSQLYDPNNPDLNIRASFQLSLDFLQLKQEQEKLLLFACLGACAPEGFAQQTAQEVSGLDAVSVSRGLGRLYSLSLVKPGAKAGWFTLHPLLFLFAREQAEKLDLLTTAEQRHTDYFMKYAEKHRGFSPESMDALETELNALLLTAQRLLITDLSAANAFYLSLERFFQARGYWTRALELISAFLQVARAKNDHYRIAHCLLQQAQFYVLLARFEEAENSLQESKVAALRIENVRERQRAVAMALTSLGGVYQRQGKYDEAVKALQQGLTIEKEHGTPLGQAKVLHSLGSVYLRQGRLDEAKAAFEQSLELGQETPKHRAEVLESLGNIYRRQGEYDKAVNVFQQSLDLEKKLGNQFGQAMVLHSLGHLYKRQGKLDAAADAYRQSLSLRSKDKHGEAQVLHSLGLVYREQGKFAEAIKVLQQSLDILVVLKDQLGQAMVYNSRGGVYQRQGKLDEAIQDFQRSYDMRQGSDDDPGRVMVLSAWGRALLDARLSAQASEKLKMSFVLSEKLRSPADLRKVTPTLVRALKMLGQEKEAREHCERALKIVPGDAKLVKLKSQLSTKSPAVNVMPNQECDIQRGRIKRIIYKSDYFYGFILPDGASIDIYFGENHVDPSLLPQLAEGQRVLVEVEPDVRGQRARRVWLDDGQ